MANFKSIAGCQVDLDHADLTGTKNVGELEAREIFSHLSASEALAANAELWEALHPSPAKKKSGKESAPESE